MRKEHKSIILLIIIMSIYTVGFDTIIDPIDNYDGLKTARIKNKKDLESDVMSVCIASDGSPVYAGTDYSNLYAYDPINDIFLWEKELDGQVKKVVTSSNGHYMLAMTGPPGEKVYLFNATGTELLKINIVCWDIEISANGNYFIILSEEGLFCYNTSSLTQLWFYDTPEEIIDGEISKDGNFIVASVEKSIIFLDSSSETPKREKFRIKLESSPNTIDISLDDEGHYIVAAGLQEGSIIVLNDTAELIWSYKYLDPVTDIAIFAYLHYRWNIIAGTNNSKLYFFIDKNGRTSVYDMEQDTLHESCKEIVVDINNIFAVAGNEWGVLYLFNVHCLANPAIHILKEASLGYKIYDIALARGGSSRFVAGCQDNYLYVLDGEGFKCPSGGGGNDDVPGFSQYVLVGVISTITLILIIKYQKKTRTQTK